MGDVATTGGNGRGGTGDADGHRDVVRVDGGRAPRCGAKRERLTIAKKQRFLDVLAATANVHRAAAAAEMSRAVFYKLRYRDERFAQSWREALESAIVRLEGEVLAYALGEAGESLTGDAERAGEAGRIDIALAVELLKRRGAFGGQGVPAGRQPRRRLPIAEVERVLQQRLAAIARSEGRE